MVNLGLTADFKRQVLLLDGTSVPMKETSILIRKKNLTSRNIREVVMHTSKPASTREYTKIMIKNICIIYAKSEFEQVAANAVQLNADEKINLMSLINDFGEFFMALLENFTQIL